MHDIKIPQNIKVADKLIGPLSLKQIIIIALGGGVSYVLFTTVQKSMGTVPGVAHAFIWLPLIFTAAFSMVRINDISLMRYLLLMLEMMSKPRQRSFLPRAGISLQMNVPTVKKNDPKAAKNAKNLVPEESNQSVTLDDLSMLLDHQGKGGDTDEKRDAASDDRELEAALLGEDTEHIQERHQKIDALIAQSSGVSSS